MLRSPDNVETVVYSCHCPGLCVCALVLGTSQTVGWCTCVKCYVCLRASKAASRTVLNAKDTFKPVEKEDANNFIWYLGFCGPKLPSTVRMLP